MSWPKPCAITVVLLSMIWALQPAPTQSSPAYSPATTDVPSVVLNDYGTTRVGADAEPPNRTFLPLVQQRWPLQAPNRPILTSISNADGDGSYVLIWQEPPTRWADSYVVEEASDTGFTTQRRSACATSGTSCLVNGRNPGTYYYRVRGHNSRGDSDWSETEAVTVSVAGWV